MLNIPEKDIRRAPLVPMNTRFGAVHLAVTAREAALAVWRDIVGLTLIGEAGDTLTLGVGETPLVVLHVNAERPVVSNSLGLYHLAIHVPERADLARFVVRAMRAGLRVSPTDHLVSEAVYAWDHDGNGIEMTFETPWRGRVNDSGADLGHFAITNDGKPHSGREPIDVNGLMEELESEADALRPLQAGTRIGHIHLHVSDIDKAMTFYRDVIGFGGFALMRKWGMGDVGLDYMPHALAFNIWSGTAATQPPEGAAGLKYFNILLPDADSLEALKARVISAGGDFSEYQGGLELADPFGNRLRIAAE